MNEDSHTETRRRLPVIKQTVVCSRRLRGVYTLAVPMVLLFFWAYHDLSIGYSWVGYAELISAIIFSVIAGMICWVVRSECGICYSRSDCRLWIRKREKN